MGKILVIDDDIQFGEVLREKLQDKFDDEVKVFDEVDYDVLNQYAVDLVFLDIEMGIVNGVDVAKVLRKRKDNPIIIFVSSKEGMIHNSLGAQPFYFVRKESLDMDLNSAFSLLKSANFRVSKKVMITDQLVDLQDLNYIEAANHYLTLYMNGDPVIVRMTMDEIGKLLENDSCVRIHRSYIVNLLAIDHWYRNRVILKDGKELEIGRKYQTEARHAYQEAKLSGHI